MEREREREGGSYACGVYQDLCNRIMKKSLVRRETRNRNRTKILISVTCELFDADAASINSVHATANKTS